MESIEQLKQDNAKLTERLNNAAKFFREQKAQIEALTKENEELKRTPKEEVIDTEKWNKLVTEKEDLNKQLNEYELKLQNLVTKINELKVKSENFETVAANKQKVIEKLESDIDSKDKAYKLLQDTYNEVWAEKEKITKQFKEQEKFEAEVINTKVPELETKLSNANAAYEELRKKYSELKKLHDDDLTRYNELEDNYEGLQNKYKEQEEQLSTAKGAVEKTIKKFEQLREANNLLQDKSVELTNDIKTYQKKYEESKVSIEEYKETIGDLNATIKKQQEEYKIVLQQVQDAKEDREEFRSQLVDLEKKYDQLDKLYDTCEAEKLSAQANCDQLQERIEYIETNNISDKEWQNHLEDVITQIRNLADDVINPKPAVSENKENIMKRTGDYNVAGENVGV